MQFYDMHSHILPEFDDGSSSVEESVTLLECLKKQSVTNVCLTPHFYTHEMSVEDFVLSRSEAVEKLKPYIPQGMNTVVGAEVYVTKFLFGNDDLSHITYGGSPYILTEFGYSSSFSDSTMDEFSKLIDNHHLIPVMPHVERYQTLMDDSGVIKELKAMGVVIQTNISNYTKKASFFKKRKLLKLINEGLIDIIGTDAHSLKHNSPELYSEAIELITAKCGEDAVGRLMANSEKIFNAALTK